MYKEVSVDELEVGMFVVNADLNWMHHPFHYCVEGRISSDRELRSIRGAGYQSAFVDMSRSVGAAGLPEDGSFDLVFSTADEGVLEAVPFEHEVETAKTIYRDSVQFARQFMKDADIGLRVDTDQAEVLVEDMIDSLSRNSDALVSLGKLKSYDEYTFTHSINVAVIALAFARSLGLSRKELKKLGFAALFHDIGKSRIDPEILNKPGRLSSEEFEEIKKHPIYSREILLKNKMSDPDVLLGVVQHHEKYNGTGYPYKVIGGRINKMSVVIGMADVYDAVTSKRAYKPAMQPNPALQIMYSMRNKAFARRYLERFIKFLGIYPVGTLVRLSNGLHGIVCESSEHRAHRPKVKIAFDAKMRPRSSRIIDLADQSGPQHSRLKIVKCLDPDRFNIDPGAVLTEEQVSSAGTVFGAI